MGAQATTDVRITPRPNPSAARTGGPTKAIPPPHRSGLRKDIQGLRALAVLVVIFNHLLHWPSGGFVGVDVFFVISGFLITDLMLREQQRTGRISYSGFYRRRFRRIIPASVLVLFVTVVAAFYIYRRVRAQLVFDDAIWSSLFMSNWHFSSVGTDYFGNENLTSPLQHFWSLAVEEQYYLAWPILLIGLAFVLRGRVGQHRHILTGFLAIVIAISLGFAWWQSGAEPTAAYFSTFTRAWELGLGAILAVNLTLVQRLPKSLQPWLSWVGLLGILASLVLIGPESRFPAPWALLPVLSAGLIIAAGANGGARMLWPLTNSASQYVGNISYSLYLWHFPIIVLMAAYFPTDTWARVLGTLLLIVILSVAGFHLVEDPIRRSTWLEPRSARTRKVRYRDAFPPPLGRRIGYGALAIAVAVDVLFIGYVIGTPQRATVAEAVFATESSGSTAPTRPAGSPQTQADQIQTALAAATFPDLSPTIDDLPDSKAPQWTENGCGTTGPWNAAECVYSVPGANRTAAVFGDSIALSWLPGLVLALNKQGYNVHSFVAGQCPSAAVSVAANGQAGENTSCDDHRQWAIGAIKELAPDLLVISDSNDLMSKLLSKSAGSALVTEWIEGATKTWKQLPSPTSTVVLSPPPGSKNLVDCATVNARPSDCVGNYLTSATWTAMNQAERAAAKSVGARYVDVSSWFCSTTNGDCPSFVGTTPVYVDGLHLTKQFSESLAPLLAKAVLGTAGG